MAIDRLVYEAALRKITAGAAPLQKVTVEELYNRRVRGRIDSLVGAADEAESLLERGRNLLEDFGSRGVADIPVAEVPGALKGPVKITEITDSIIARERRKAAQIITQSAQLLADGDEAGYEKLQAEAEAIRTNAGYVKTREPEIREFVGEEIDFTLIEPDPNPNIQHIEVVETNRRAINLPEGFGDEDIAAVNDFIEERLKTNKENPKKEEDAPTKQSPHLEPPVAAPAPDEQTSALVKKPEEDVELDLAKLGLGRKQFEIAEAIPQETDLVIPRSELHHSFYPDKSPATSRIDNMLIEIQGKLPAGYTIVNYGSGGRDPSLYGIRKRKDYEGSLDESRTVPRVIMAEKSEIDKGAVITPTSTEPVEAQVKGVIDIQQPDQEKITEEAKLLMDQINKSLEGEVSLDPEIMKALQEAYDEVMGVPIVKNDVQPVIEPKSPATKRITRGLEDFLPELPVGQAAPAKSETEQIVPFEQREENKIKPEERYVLGFVFGLLAEARERNEQYINNDDFQTRLKPRREYEQDGKTYVESYSTSDIIRLFGGALEKLIKESQQPLIQWDDETRELFHSVTTYAGDRGKNVESIRWPLRVQLIAITRALDMGSRRVKEKE